MKQQHISEAIILTRTDYGEADRIITVLTPQAGKLRLIAKGVRRVKSKLAGGIELFSVTDITYLHGRGEIGTLISARLKTHYGHIVHNIERTMLGYELINQLHKATEDETETEYFYLLEEGFAALNDITIPLDLLSLWFAAQLLRLSGHTPNLITEQNGTKLTLNRTYDFNYDDAAFVDKLEGTYHTDDIKFLRLVFEGHLPKTLLKIGQSTQLTGHVLPLVIFMRQQYIRR